MKKLKIPKITLEQMTLWMMIIAFFALFHTIYRANVNESNQTQRDAGFRILTVSNELQTLLDTNYYHKPINGIHYIGWSKILSISDMSIFMDNKVVHKAKILKHQWATLSQKLKNKDVNLKFAKTISDLKDAVKVNLKSLN